MGSKDALIAIASCKRVMNNLVKRSYLYTQIKFCWISVGKKIVCRFIQNFALSLKSPSATFQTRIWKRKITFTTNKHLFLGI